MTVEVAMRQDAERTVLRMSGTAGEDLLVQLADGIAAVAEATASLVVEVHDLVLADVRAVQSFARRLVEIGVFATADDAVLALRTT